jgi:hypothetical protein
MRATIWGSQAHGVPSSSIRPTPFSIDLRRNSRKGSRPLASPGTLRCNRCHSSCWSRSGSAPSCGSLPRVVCTARGEWSGHCDLWHAVVRAISVIFAMDFLDGTPGSLRITPPIASESGQAVVGGFQDGRAAGLSIPAAAHGRDVQTDHPGSKGWHMHTNICHSQRHIRPSRPAHTLRQISLKRMLLNAG